MLIRAPYDHGSVFINSREYYIQNGRCEVSYDVAAQLLCRGNYTVDIRNPMGLSDANRMLIVRGSGLGDVLLCVPIVRYIKTYINKNVEIDWLCGSKEFASVLEGVPWINKVFGRQDMPHNASDLYNYIFNIDNAEFMDQKSRTTHRIDLFAHRASELKDVVIEDKHLEYYIRDDEKQWFATLGIKHPFITMTTQTTCFNRVFEDHQNQIICNKILNKGIGVVILDKNRKEMYDSRAINMQGQLTLRQSAAIMYHADIVLTPDTGIFHIASAMNKKILAYFGAINSQFRITSDKVTVLTNKIPCYPCDNYTCHNGVPLCVRGLNLDVLANTVAALVAQN